MKKPYVAIVDDDSGFANYLRTFLSLRGYETRSYSRGDEMIASVKQGDPPDVVLLDVMMPGHERARDAPRAEGGEGRPAGDHAVGARAGGDDRRGGPPGRGRLRGQARRSGGSRRDRARCRHQERDREDAPRLRDHRAAPAAQRRPGPRVPVLGRQPRDEVDRVGDRAGVRQRRHGADPRRERRRQGAGRARDSPALAAQGSAVREGELRRPAGGTARKRAVRPREGRLHRRGHHPHRQVRAGRHRHDLPRRDRRDEGRAAGQDAARAAGRPVHQARQQQADQRGRARRRGDQPRPRGHDASRRVPRRPLLPAEGDRGDRAAAPRAARRDHAPDRFLHGSVRAALQPPGPPVLARADGSSSRLTTGRATSASSRT